MRKKILIVEDNAELLALLRLALRRAGFAVSSATNGVAGLKKIRSLIPDLLVLDLVLPEMDGFAVCEAVRRDRNLCRTPVILLTGLTSAFSRYAGLESGADDYVTKPISPEQLVSKIRKRLRLGGQKRTAISSNKDTESPG